MYALLFLGFFSSLNLILELDLRSFSFLLSSLFIKDSLLYDFDRSRDREIYCATGRIRHSSIRWSILWHITYGLLLWVLFYDGDKNKDNKGDLFRCYNLYDLLDLKKLPCEYKDVLRELSLII